MASIVRSTAGRAVHLRITPRPSNLGESREILRLISQFGEVEYFKNLKYDALTSPNTALVIFREEEAAVQTLKRSPIRFRMGRAPADEAKEEHIDGQHTYAQPAQQQSYQYAPDTLSPASPLRTPAEAAPQAFTQTRSMSTKALPNPPPQPGQTPFQPPPPQLLESRIFQIQTHPARIQLRDQINMGYYHGRFPIDTKSIPQRDLQQTVPLLGLSCINWRVGERPWRVVDREKEREHTGPGRRESLRELYDEKLDGAATFRDEALPA